MKLDRNINPDGRGKYALINLRTNQVQWGGEDQFFVIKYKDEFASAALRAYAQAVFERAHSLNVQSNRIFDDLTAQGHHREALEESTKLSGKAQGLLEYASEILRESETAEKWPTKKLPD